MCSSVVLVRLPRNIMGSTYESARYESPNPRAADMNIFRHPYPADLVLPLYCVEVLTANRSPLGQSNQPQPPPPPLPSFPSRLFTA